MLFFLSTTTTTTAITQDQTDQLFKKKDQENIRKNPSVNIIIKNSFNI